MPGSTLCRRTSAARRRRGRTPSGGNAESCIRKAVGERGLTPGLVGLVDTKAEIGIGGSLAPPPLPHHRAYGSVPRRFDRVKRLAMPPIEEGRSSRRTRWTMPAVLSHGEPCARIQTLPRQRRPRGSGTHPGGAIARTEAARSSGGVADELNHCEGLDVG